ncbi:DbpA RNA binding domain-containing protein [Oerskovia sp. M15]
MGHTHGAQPSGIVGALTNEGGLNGKDLGKIDIFPSFSLVDIATRSTPPRSTASRGPVSPASRCASRSTRAHPRAPAPPHQRLRTRSGGYSGGHSGHGPAAATTSAPSAVASARLLATAPASADPRPGPDTRTAEHARAPEPHGSGASRCPRGRGSGRPTARRQSSRPRRGPAPGPPGAPPGPRCGAPRRPVGCP